MTWRERIIAARERGSFTKEDVTAATYSWTTCAVGEQHKNFPNVVLVEADCFGVPKDKTLWRLGNTLEGFGKAVQNNQINQAEDLLDAIEDRVLQLKRKV